MIPDINTINQASERIKKYIHRTPILTSSIINKIFDANIFFKCENFQKAGAFKSRGACNALLSLNNQKLKKVLLRIHPVIMLRHWQELLT